MKYLNNSKGYTLLLTFAIIILFTVLGLSLITLTSNGLNKNETRQDNTQAKDLAEKGVDYLQREIELILNKELEEDKKDNRIDIPNLFKTTFITNTTAKYFCTPNLTSGVQIPTDNGDNTYACIEKPASETDLDYVVSETTRAVRIRSTGIVDGKNFTYYSTVQFSFSSVPKQLSYAISTNKQGDLYFFGGTDITGDIKVAGDLLVSDSTFWSHTYSPTWIKSTYPKLMSSRVNGVSNIILNEGSTEEIIAAKKVYKITSNPGDIRPLLSGASADTKKMFAEEISLDDTEDIQNLFLHSDTPIYPGIGDLKSTFPQMPNIIKSKPLQDDQVKISEAINEISIKSGSEVEKVQEDFRINASGDYNVSKTAKYINGNVNISPPSSRNSKLEVNLSGNYYVDGNLYIGRTNLNANAIFYVKGTTHIEFSTIKKLENNGTLFIFSENSITINNISEGSAEANSSEIDGFFYSNNNFLMYGVGSNTRITGGISAKNAIFTSLRGNSYDKGDLTNSIPNACKIEYITSPEDTMFFNNTTITWAERLNNLQNKNSGKSRWTNVTNNDPFSYPIINSEWLDKETYNYTFLQQTNGDRNGVKYTGKTNTLLLSEWNYIIRLLNDPYSIPFLSSVSSLDFDTEQLIKITDKLDLLLSQWDSSTVKRAYKKFSYGTSPKIREYNDGEWKTINEDLNKLSHYLKIKIDNPVSIPNYCLNYYEDTHNRSNHQQGDSLYLQLRSNSRIKVFYNHDLIDQFIEHRAYQHININDIEVMTPVVKKIEWD